MKRLATAIAAIALIGTPAFSADMAVKAPPPAPAGDMWTGFYLGVNVGWEWLHTAAFTVAPDPATAAFIAKTHTVFPGSLSSNGAEGGGQSAITGMFRVGC